MYTSALAFPFNVTFVLLLHRTNFCLSVRVHKMHTICINVLFVKLFLNFMKFIAPCRRRKQFFLKAITCRRGRF